MTDYEKTRAALREFVANNSRSSLLLAKVVSVRQNEATCEVKLLDNEEIVISEVRLQAISGSGWLLLPKVGSQVIVAELGLSQGWCVLVFSDIDKAILKTENGIEFNRGSKGAMVEIDKLKQRLNNIETAFNGLLNEYKLHAHTDPLSGSTGTLLVPSVQNNLVSTQTADLANNDIKQ